MSDKVRFDSYKKALHSAWDYNDYNDWPIKVNSVMHLYLKEFSKEFVEDIGLLQAKGVSTDEIAKAFGNPARLFRVIDPVIYGMKRAFKSLDEQRDIVLYLLDSVKSMKYGSEFNEDGINTILNPEQLISTINDKNMLKAHRDDSVKIHRFCGIMWAYTEAIFFRAHDITKEIHGPYKIDEKSNQLLIREYLHLQPSDIWGDIPFLPYKTIKVYAEYSKDLKVRIDSYNHLFLMEGNYVNDLISFQIEADGKVISIEELDNLMLTMQETIKTVHDWVGKSDWKAITNRYADIHWYRKSPLRKLTGNDWRVPQVVRDSIENGSINKSRLRNLTKEEIDRLISIVI